MFTPTSFRFPVKIRKPAGHWLDDPIFESKKWGTCRTVSAAAKRGGLPLASLNLWIREPCRYNEGEKIFTLHPPSPYGKRHPRMHVIPDKILDAIAERYRHRYDFKNAPAIPSNKISDDAYLPTPEFGEAIGLTTGLPKKKARIKVKAFIKAWLDKMSQLRPGEQALRRGERTSTDASQKLTKPKTWRVGDGRAILKGEESKHPSIGRPGTRRPTALKNQEAQSLIERHFLEQGIQTRKSLKEFCKKHFISKRQLHAVLKKLRVKSTTRGRGWAGTRYHYLPSQAAPDQLAQSPVLRRTVEFLKETLAGGQKLPRKKVVQLWRQAGFLGSDSVLVKARRLAGVVSEGSKENSRLAIWSLANGNGVGTNGQGNATTLELAKPPTTADAFIKPKALSDTSSDTLPDTRKKSRKKTALGNPRDLSRVLAILRAFAPKLKDGTKIEDAAEEIASEPNEWGLSASGFEKTYHRYKHLMGKAIREKN